MDKKMWEFELHFFLQEYFQSSSDETFNMSNLVSRGSYVEALMESSCQEIFENANCELAVGLEEVLQSSIAAYLTRSDYMNKNIRQHRVLCIGIAALQLFVQSNFTGPMVVLPFQDIFPIFLKSINLSNHRKMMFESIGKHTEGIFPLARDAEYILLAKVIFCALFDSLDTCLSRNWWALRFCIVLQSIGEENSSHLYERICKFYEQLPYDEDSRLVSQILLEAGQAFLQFSVVGTAAECFRKAASLLKINASLTGAMGRRTRYQVDPKAQLVLKVEYTDQAILEAEMGEPSLLSKDFPKDVMLNDDTRLPHMKFENEDDDRVPNLKAREQMVLLATIHQKRRSQAADLQLKEETKAYLNALLQYPKSWMVQFQCLRLRSLLESEESRAVDRALQQLEELTACVSRKDPSRYERLKFVYASSLPPYWTTKQEYGKLLVQMGCIKTALPIFEELHLMEDVIDCYNRIGMRHRNVAIIQKLLEKEETPNLWCLLGDATDNCEHYEKAWEVSQHKSSRAQRCLGYYYFQRKNYNKALEHYKMSVKLNYLQIGVWQNLAYCALQLKDWKLCCSSYKQCTTLDPDFFEFWNNLAKCYVELKEMDKALTCLEEAVRCKSDSWKTFENLMTVATSVGKFNTALFAYKRLLDLKPRHINYIVISGLVSGFINCSKDDSSLLFYKSLVQFLNQFCNSCPSESDLWYYLGEIVSYNPDPTIESREISCQHFRKSIAAATRSSGWWKDIQVVVMVLKKVVRYQEALTNAMEGVAMEVTLINLRSASMIIQNVLTLARKGLTNVSSGEIVPDGIESLNNAETAQTRIKGLIDQLNRDVC